MNLKPPDWVGELRESLNREFGERPWIASLATVDSTHSPQVRSIVIREIETDGSIWFATDARSAKVEQLSQDRRVQVLIWLPRERTQYRLTGDARREVDGEILQSHWSKLSDATREMFFWGDQPDVEFAKTKANSPVNFVVYRIWMSAFEFLSLDTTPHTRWIARQTDGWKRRGVQP